MDLLKYYKENCQKPSLVSPEALARLGQFDVLSQTWKSTGACVSKGIIQELDLNDYIPIERIFDNVIHASPSGPYWIHGSTPVPAPKTEFDHLKDIVENR